MARPKQVSDHSFKFFLEILHNNTKQQCFHSLKLYIQYVCNNIYRQLQLIAYWLNALTAVWNKILELQTKTIHIYIRVSNTRPAAVFCAVCDAVGQVSNN